MPGWGKPQFRAVMSAISLLPEETRPRVIGLAPTHRAVGEMQSAGVDARTTASFLHDTQLLQRNGQTPDFSNTLFLLDESSMVGLADMAKAHSSSPPAVDGRCQRGYRPAAAHRVGPAVQADAAAQRRRRCHHERDCTPDA